MSHYRLYFLGGGHIRQAIDLECATEEDAMAAVVLHTDGRPMELWRGGECIARFDAVKDEA